jgi:hypothetical protein
VTTLIPPLKLFKWIKASVGESANGSVKGQNYISIKRKKHHFKSDAFFALVRFVLKTYEASATSQLWSRFNNIFNVSP